MIKSFTVALASLASVSNASTGSWTDAELEAYIAAQEGLNIWERDDTCTVDPIVDATTATGTKDTTTADDGSTDLAATYGDDHEL